MHAPTVKLTTAPYALPQGRSTRAQRPPARMVLSTLSLAATGILVLLLAGHGRSAAPLPRVHGTSASLTSLPATSRGPVSATLGAADPAYRVLPGSRGLTARNPAQRLSARFTSSGVAVRAGDVTAGLTLEALGHGSALAPMAEVAPSASANRVTYRRAGLSEWYANGPLGIEQGFTVAGPAVGAGRGPLTFAISVSGRATLSGQTLLFKRAGQVALSYGGLRATDASGRVLASHLRLHGDRLLLQIDTARARYPLTVDPLIQQGSKLTGTGESGAGNFGYSVALSADGNTALVGGYSDGAGVGAAWVFTRTNSTWTQQGPKLTAGGEGGKGLFGITVALSGDGNTALIGASADKFTSTQEQTGSVRVFTRSGATWTEAQKLESGVGGANDGFGSSLAISSDAGTAAIGAPNDDENHGGIWIFEKQAGVWTLRANLVGCEKYEGLPLKCVKREEEGANADLGASLALSADGSSVIAGAPGDEGGSLWTFIRLTGEKPPYYTEEGKRKVPSDATPKSRFGSAVALSGDGSTALIGGPGDSSGVGAAWVFTQAEFKWKQEGLKLTATGENGPGEFGASLALSGDGRTAIIGTPEEEHGKEGEPGWLEEEGSVWQFTRTEGTWKQAAKINGSGTLGTEGTPYGSLFGAGVALSADGATALVGGPDDNANLGALWVFSSAAGPTVKEEPKPLPPVEIPKGAPKVTPAQIAALLGSGLVPSGKAAKIASLLKHGSFATKLSALEAGQATISWYQVPPGAKLATKQKPKPVLVASGRLSFAGPGSGVLKLKLTAAGKRLLKHSRRVKLVARAGFTPSGGATVTATRPFVLKR